MKFRIKALDNHEEELKIIENFYRAKYNKNEIEDLSINYSTYSKYKNLIEWKKDIMLYILSIDYSSKTVIKASKPSLNMVPFEKDELKLFDSLNYDINDIHKKETKQDITDWIGIE